MASRFWVGGTGTWDASDTTHWAASSNGAGGASVPGSGDTVTLDALSGGGTVTVNTTVTVTSITMGAFTGTLDFAANDNNVNAVTFDGNGAGTRTLNMGDGTWTLSGSNANAWNYSTVTGLTHNANSSTLIFTQTAGTSAGTTAFVTGGQSFNAVSVGTNSNANVFNITGAATFASLAITAPCSVQFPSATTLTISGAFTWAGTSSAHLMLASSTTTSAATIVVAAGSTIDWAALRRITFSVNAVTATNSFDLKSNTLVTITPPSAGGSGGGSVFGAQGGVIT